MVVTDFEQQKNAHFMIKMTYNNPLTEEVVFVDVFMRIILPVIEIPNPDTFSGNTTSGTLHAGK